MLILYHFLCVQSCALGDFTFLLGEEVALYCAKYLPDIIKDQKAYKEGKLQKVCLPTLFLVHFCRLSLFLPPPPPILGFTFLIATQLLLTIFLKEFCT